MTLLEYRIFHTVTEQGSFARAAQALHLTPSAISHAVSSMEEACGFSLFVRGKSGVSLTRNGEALYTAIRQVLAAKFGAAAEECPILYGGSCKPSNAPELFAKEDVDGGLIGGAALKAADFLAIGKGFPQK